MAHAPASIGTIPAEANSKGGLNAAPPKEQRAPDGAPLSDGPIRGEKESFMPASYKTSRGLVRTDR